MFLNNAKGNFLIKSLFIILLFLTSLVARENPFFSVAGEQEIPLTSNEDRSLEPLKRATITLPSTARVIEGVTINYKSLDGSKHSKTIELNHAVDWHLPVFITQSYQDNPKKVDSITEEIKRIKKQKLHYKKKTGLSFISFYESGKNLKIITNDSLLRKFLLVKPHRIVCDFKRDIDIRSHDKSFKNSIFKRIRIGNHKGYYRVVVELDGKYKYSTKKIDKGYLLRLR